MVVAGWSSARQDSIEDAYANLQNYTEWVQFETHPLLKVEDAVPILMNRFS